jgi:sulfofructose kinase
MDETRPRIICLGLSALDQIWNVEILPAGTSKTRANDHAQSGGGMAATAAVAAARLGACVAFWGRAGDDGAGRDMRAELSRYGVDTEGFRLFAGARSSVSCVIVDASGERMIVNFRGAGLPEDTRWLPLEDVARADAVLADPRWPAGSVALFEAARRHGVPTVLDGDVADAAVFDRVLPHTDFAVFSEPGLAGYAGGGDVAAGLRRARQRGCSVAAVTLGERGVVWDDGQTLHRLPAFPADVVDTNGAGDVFHGALAVALGRKWPVREAFRFSAAVAALKCTRPGGRAGAPDLVSAMSFLHEFKE